MKRDHSQDYDNGLVPDAKAPELEKGNEATPARKEGAMGNEPTVLGWMKNAAERIHELDCERPPSVRCIADRDGIARVIAWYFERAAPPADAEFTDGELGFIQEATEYAKPHSSREKADQESALEKIAALRRARAEQGPGKEGK